MYVIKSVKPYGSFIYRLYMASVFHNFLAVENSYNAQDLTKHKLGVKKRLYKTFLMTF